MREGFTGMFDPAIGPDPNIRQYQLRDAFMAGSRPVFLDVHGMRQSVETWNGALRFTLSVAQRALECNGMLEKVSGCEIRPGKHREGFTYCQSIDASIRSMSAGLAREAIRRTVERMHLPFTVRYRWDEEGPVEALAKNVPHPSKVPTLGKLLPYVRGHAPALTERMSATTVDIQSEKNRSDILAGRVLPGSSVVISIEGVITRGRFRIVPGRGDPARGQLGISSPISAAIIGHRAGDDCAYQVGLKTRPIDLLSVDNAALAIAHGLISIPGPAEIPERAREPVMDHGM